MYPHIKVEQTIESKKTLNIKVFVPEIENNQSVAIVGAQDELGNWNPGKALLLSRDNLKEWSIKFDAVKLSYPIEFKFIILDSEDKSLIEWEKGENRLLSIPPLNENEVCTVYGLNFRKNACDWKCAGTVIPVFSLRSRNSFGIGDFGDLKIIIDWLNLTEQKILQILPINDTTQTHTWTDSYPYNSISIFALHPIYMNLNSMGELKSTERKDFYLNKQIELNALEDVDYDQVDKYKRMFFREIFSQEGEKTLQSQEFQSFFECNKEWLIPYSAYSYLREKYNTCNFNLWKKFRKYDKNAIEQLCSPVKKHYREISMYYYLQFHLHKQLIEIKEYANSKDILLKGDIPIGISRTSIEAWTEPDLFNINYQTGAPPDDFSITGQNWGFPTYNWEKIEADNFRWWKKRFKKMAEYFDAFRIDHILGFFRIWEIPEDSVQGLLGRFSPSLPFSIEEIKNSGFVFDIDRYTIAIINEKILPELFGEYTEEVKQVYLKKFSKNHFTLKKSYNTQLKIQNHFSGKDDNKNLKILNGLFYICNEVLFIKDKLIHNHFHPRISAYNSIIYRELDYSNKNAFDYLYQHYFYQRHNEFWKEEGFKKLIPLVSCTDMLACGEDLGMIPDCVPEVMQKLQILSLEIERMPKEINREFTDLDNLPYLSVCSTSTHDMPTIRMAWSEDLDKTQRYYNEVLKNDGIAPEDCLLYLCEQIIFNHLNSNSMLAIFPLQDWLSICSKTRRQNVNTERINFPSIPKHYWKYRIHLFLEDLLSANELNDKILKFIKLSQRD